MKTVSATTHPLAVGVCRSAVGGIGDNVPTRTTHDEQDRTGGQRVTFGSYAAPIGTR
jgi:hypothetical protein